MVKRLKIGVCLAAIAVGVLSTGCHLRFPGQPTEAERWRRPTEVTDFNQIYAQNCAGCHGAGGKNGAARSLNDPLYQAFIPDDELRKVIAQGQASTSMPAFSQQAGGNLTDEQIALLISGMRANWAKPDEFKGVTLPPYKFTPTAGSGNPATVNSNAVVPITVSVANGGAAAYQTYCTRCHGADGAGGTAGSIVDPNYLKLVSDQGLRTTVVVGRADLGKPDWRANVPGRTMSAQEIDDVLAWLAARRKANDANPGKSGLAGPNPK